jgi:hypothetical protein
MNGAPPYASHPDAHPLLSQSLISSAFADAYSSIRVPNRRVARTHGTDKHLAAGHWNVLVYSETAFLRTRVSAAAHGHNYMLASYSMSGLREPWPAYVLYVAAATRS